MATTRGVRSSGRSGLTGYRYLLVVALLVALASVPMLLATLAGAATLREPSPAAGASPFVTYRTHPAPAATGDTGWWW